MNFDASNRSLRSLDAALYQDDTRGNQFFSRPLNKRKGAAKLSVWMS